MFFSLSQIFSRLLKTSDGYFVHHFAPSNLERISKNVVFVIDQSGSMHGRKIQQVQYLCGVNVEQVDTFK